MPNFVSYRGKCYPAKEKIALVNKSDQVIEYNGQKINPGDPFIYDGPDREALKMLHEAGQDHLGVDFLDCSEFQDFINQKHQGDAEKYLKRIGFDSKKDEEKFKEKISKVEAHTIPKRVQEIKIMGGGQDRTGARENDVIGGFGDQRLRKPDEIKV